MARSLVSVSAIGVSVVFWGCGRQCPETQEENLEDLKQINASISECFERNNLNIHQLHRHGAYAKAQGCCGREEPGLDGYAPIGACRNVWDHAKEDAEITRTWYNMDINHCLCQTVDMVAFLGALDDIQRPVSACAANDPSMCCAVLEFLMLRGANVIRDADGDCDDFIVTELSNLAEEAIDEDSLAGCNIAVPNPWLLWTYHDSFWFTFFGIGGVASGFLVLVFLCHCNVPEGDEEEGKGDLALAAGTYQAPSPKTEVKPDRTFDADNAKGGANIVAHKTAILLIEFQNEFVTEGGKLHDAVKGVMNENGMLQNTVKVVEKGRAAGMSIFHAPITFNNTMTDNPNKGLGILKDCSDGAAFLEGTWNSELCKEIPLKPSDVMIKDKHGLDAFPGTNLEDELQKRGIETLVITGLLTNCCCESTMRTAYEKGFNVVSLIDCMAASSMDAHKASIDGAFGMFSTRMTCQDFMETVLGVDAK